MNKISLIAILATLTLFTGCINCVNQSVHGTGGATVIKSDSKAVATPKKIAVNTTTNNTSDWVLISTTKEIISSQPVLF